jgi:hypothetical protein
MAYLDTNNIVFSIYFIFIVMILFFLQTTLNK